MASRLDDQLARVGEATGMMADEPKPIVEDDPTRRNDAALNLSTGAAAGSRVEPCGRRTDHVPSAIRSFMIHTLVAKNSRIIMAWSSASISSTNDWPSVPFVFRTFSFTRIRRWS